jgi:hypothetical protein
MEVARWMESSCACGRVVCGVFLYVHSGDGVAPSTGNIAGIRDAHAP